MIARITNFASKENQIIDWDNEFYAVTSIHLKMNNKKYFDLHKEELDRLLEQLNLLLEKYPDALNEKTVLKKASSLVKYSKEKGFTLSNLYSYFNEEKKNIDRAFDIKKSTYGIRTLYDRWDNLLVNITGYDLTSSGIIYNKNELYFKCSSGNFDSFKLIHRDCCASYIYDEKALTYLNPKILTRHL